MLFSSRVNVSVRYDAQQFAADLSVVGNRDAGETFFSLNIVNI